jgi:hypothetical protein
MIVQRYGIAALDDISFVNLRMMMLDRVEFLKNDNDEQKSGNTEVTYNKVDNLDFTPDEVLINGRTS